MAPASRGAHLLAALPPALGLALVLAALPQAPADGAEGFPAEAAGVDVDDECGAGAEECAVNAMQLRARKHTFAAETAPSHDSLGGCLSSKQCKAFSWTAPTRSVEEALSAPGWQDRYFNQGQEAGTITLAKASAWIRDELFGGADPFGRYGTSVPVPWPQNGGDQVGPGEWVAYSRRQVCFIVAKALTGAGTAGYANGLTRFMAGCPKTGGFGKSMATLLASCAADPSLANGAQGPLVLVARAESPPAVRKARGIARQTSLEAAGLRVCQYNDGAPELGALPKVPAAGCAPPSSTGPGLDFMTGGLKAQATQDISASFLGGYVFGNACGLGGGQDERLMVYFPEVAALTFFLSSDWQFPQLRQPAWVLGARKFFTGLDGSARFNEPLILDADVPLTSDLEAIQVGGLTYKISVSRPFLAFMSENQGFLGHEDTSTLHPARRNKHPLQRLVGREKFAFEKQVRAWYGSVALTSYHNDVQPALKQLVGSVGTGPWLAGLWWGDSQLGLLAVWIGHALAAPTWGDSFPLDYYMYADFTENPGNQCFVHSSSNCAACLGRCNSNPLPGSAFWMPGAAFMAGKSCAQSDADCGTKGIEHVVEAYAGKSAAELWDNVEGAIRGKGTEQTVFDLLLR